MSTRTTTQTLSLRRYAARFLGRASSGLGHAKMRMEDAQLALNFLRGRLEHQPDPSDIFVVTYPRSGTTWVQFLVYQLTTPGSMDFEHLTDVSPWFERSLARGTHRAANFFELPRPRLFKSHLTPGWLPETGRFVVVERSPEDVAVSYYHFYRSHLGFQGSVDRFLERFLRGDVQYGAWADHVGEWRERRGHENVLWLTYSELQQSLVSVVDRLAGFLDLSLSPEARERAITRSSFAFMKQHEALFDHTTAILKERGMRRGSFLRRGQSDAGAQELTTESRGRIREESRRSPRRRRHRTDLAKFLR